jgi:hypothetical protein
MLRFEPPTTVGDRGHHRAGLHLQEVISQFWMMFVPGPPLQASLLPPGGKGGPSGGSGFGLSLPGTWQTGPPHGTHRAQRRAHGCDSEARS